MKLISVLIFTLSFSSSIAQTNFDSLKLVISNGSDSVKYRISGRTGLAYQYIDKDSTLKYFQISYEACERNNWYEGMGNVKLYFSGYYYYSLQDTTAISLIKEALKWYTEADNNQGILNSYYMLGTYLGGFEDFDSSVFYLQKGVQFGEEIHDSAYLPMIYNNLGLMFQYQGFNKEANDYFLKSITLKEAIPNSNLRSTYLNIGLNYYNISQNDKAIAYYKKAELLFIDHHEDQPRALALKNIGDAFSDDNQLDSAVVYYNLAHAIFEELGDSNSVARYYLSMGEIATKKEEYQKAKELLDLALYSLPKSANSRLIIYIQISRAENYLTLNSHKNPRELNEVIANLQDADVLSKEIGLFSPRVTISYLLYEAYELLGEYKLASQYAKEHIVLSDSLFNQQSSEAIAKQNAKFESEKKELKIQFLAKENDLKNTKLIQNNELQTKQQHIIYLLFSGVFFTGIFVFVIFKFYRKQKIFNTNLQIKNTVIGKQNKEKIILLQEIHHRVKNNLQIVWNLLDLQAYNIPNPEIKAAINDGKNRVNSMATLHTMLYQNDDLGNVSFEEYLSKLVAQIKNTFSITQNYEVIIAVPSDIKFDLDTSIPLGLIVTELFTNALKYAITDEKKAVIELKVEKINADEYTLTIRDNGPGLPAGFDSKKTGTLGLKLVPNLCRQVQGSLKMMNDNGAVYIIRFKGKSFDVE